MKLNETIRRLRRAKGLTQEQVAQRMGKSPPAITNMLRLLALPVGAISNTEPPLSFSWI